MKLAYPVTPVRINQRFGANPDYYSKFLDVNKNPEKGHMGIDFQAAHGQPVYAAHDGFAFYVGPDIHGGDGVYLRFEDEDAPGNWYTVINWHLCSKEDTQYPPTVGEIGKMVKKGDLIGYADNTGAPFESSGDHLHFGLVPCDKNGTFLYPGNGFGGCIDPEPYFATEDTPESRLEALAAHYEASGNLHVAQMLRAIIGIVRSFSTPSSGTAQ